MKLLCAFRAAEQYERLQRMLPYPQLEWSDNIASAQELEQLMQASRYDLFLLDPLVWWSQQGNELARSRGVEVVLFDGDVRSAAQLIGRKIAPFLERDGEAAEPVRPVVDPEEETGRGPVRIIEKEKIVEVEKIIEKEKIVERQVKVAVPVHSYVSMQSKICLFLNLTPRAGATFLTTMLAKAVAMRSLHCTLIEHPTNQVSLYDLLNVAEHKPEMRPALEVLEYGALKKESEFHYNGISMYLNHPNFPYEEVSADELRELLYQLRQSPFIFYDASFHKELFNDDLFAEFDHIFVVVDPDPVLLQRILEPSPDDRRQATEEYLLLKDLLRMEQVGHFQVHVVVNRNNFGVDQKLLAQCLPKKPLTMLPALPYEVIYKAAWEAGLIDIEDELDDALMPILKLIVPENFLAPKDEEKGGRLFGRLFGKK